MRGFLADRRGNYALMTAVAMVPLMGGLAHRRRLSRDEPAEAGGRQRARRGRHRDGPASGERRLRQPSSSPTPGIFFEANLGSVNPADTQLTVTLPANQDGGGTLKLSAKLNYKPHLLPGLRRT